VGVEVLLTLVEFGYDLTDELKDGFWNIGKAHFLLVFEAFHESQDIITAAINMPGLEVSDELRPGDVLSGFELLLGTEKGLDLYPFENASQTYGLVEIGLEHCGDAQHFR
jgi:hypothetical protein